MDDSEMTAEDYEKMLAEMDDEDISCKYLIVNIKIFKFPNG